MSPSRDGPEAPRSTFVVGSPGRIIARRSSVAVVLLDGLDAVLVQQWRPSVGRETVELVQEQIESGESPEAAGRRGIWEECGLKTARLTEHGGFWGSPAYSTQWVHVLSAVVAQSGSDTPPPIPTIRTMRCAFSDVENLVDDAISIAALSVFRMASRRVPAGLQAAGRHGR
jgi:hypothetical protein